MRFTHIQSGLSAECRETASQDTNQKIAFRRVAEKVIAWWRKERAVETFKEEMKTVRTYNYEDNRITDHDSKKKYTTDTDFSLIVQERFLDQKRKELDK